MNKETEKSLDSVGKVVLTWLIAALSGIGAFYVNWNVYEWNVHPSLVVAVFTSSVVASLVILWASQAYEHQYECDSESDSL